MIHIVKGFDVVNKAVVVVFLEHSCLFDDPTDVGNLISGSSVFSKSSLNIWMLLDHVLLKLDLENFRHYFVSMWDECNCVVVWVSLALPFFGIGTKTYFFQSCYYFWVFQICWHIECNTFTAPSDSWSLVFLSAYVTFIPLLHFENHLTKPSMVTPLLP